MLVQSPGASPVGAGGPGRPPDLLAGAAPLPRRARVWTRLQPVLGSLRGEHPRLEEAVPEPLHQRPHTAQPHPQRARPGDLRLRAGRRVRQRQARDRAVPPPQVPERRRGHRVHGGPAAVRGGQQLPRLPGGLLVILRTAVQRPEVLLQVQSHHPADAVHPQRDAAEPLRLRRRGEAVLRGGEGEHEQTVLHRRPRRLRAARRRRLLRGWGLWP